MIDSRQFQARGRKSSSSALLDLLEHNASARALSATGSITPSQTPAEHRLDPNQSKKPEPMERFFLF